MIDEFEDLEAMLSDSDAHALQESVVEVGNVVLLQLVASEQQRVLADNGWIEAGIREPGKPIHDWFLWR